MRRLRGMAASVAMLGLLAGCESQVRKPADPSAEDLVTGRNESRPKRAGFSPGGWSSRAREVESGIMNSTADPDWGPGVMKGRGDSGANW